VMNNVSIVSNMVPSNSLHCARHHMINFRYRILHRFLGSVVRIAGDVSDGHQHLHNSFSNKTRSASNSKCIDQCFCLGDKVGSQPRQQHSDGNQPGPVTGLTIDPVLPLIQAHRLKGLGCNMGRVLPSIAPLICLDYHVQNHRDRKKQQPVVHNIADGSAGPKGSDTVIKPVINHEKPVDLFPRWIFSPLFFRGLGFGDGLFDECFGKIFSHFSALSTPFNYSHKMTVMQAFQAFSPGYISPFSSQKGAAS